MNTDPTPQRGHCSITLPLPPTKCSPNSRGKHWGGKARAVKSYRETCGLIAKRIWGQRDAMAGMVTITLDFYLCRGIHTDSLYLPRDPDNALASAKGAIDSLKDAGVIKGDSKKFVRIGEVTLYTKAPEHQGRTELVLSLSSEGDASTNDRKI